MNAGSKAPMGRLQHLWKDRYMLLFLLPMLILLFIFCYIPMFGILVSFQNYKIGKPFFAFDGSIEWVGLKHFIHFFQSVFFSRVMKNTISISIYTIIFGFWIPIAFALLLNEIKHSVFKRIIQTASYLPYFISSVIIIGIVVSMLSSVDGVINRMIEYFGGTPIQFLNEPPWFKPIYITTIIWQTFGWSSILYLANISKIDQALYEAAKIDGANRWSQMLHITLPGIAPTITILLIFSIGGIMNADTEKIFLMYNPAVYDTADVIGTYVIREGIYSTNYSYAAAIGLFSNVINLILLTLSNKVSRKINGFAIW